MTSTTVRPRRSALYMPASNAKAIEKARNLDCDAVILDLEDAVAPDAKDAARLAAHAAITNGGFAPKELIIRVNGLETPWGELDLAAAVAARPNAILVPKVSNAAEDFRYREHIADTGIDLWVMIETARSLFNLAEIASAGLEAGLTCFVMGTNDLAKETGVRLVPGREPMLAALGLSVAAAKSRYLCILDGVYNDLEDVTGLTRECEQGRDFGFDGKTLVHPRQIGPCNDAFTPAEHEIAYARAVVAAFAIPENTNRGAIRVEGKMAERLHLAQSERLLAMVDAIRANSAGSSKSA